LTGNLPGTATGGCGDSVIVDDGSCIYVPDNFEFSQSTLQAPDHHTHLLHCQGDSQTDN
jgi:hypothetical protein